MEWTCPTQRPTAWPRSSTSTTPLLRWSRDDGQKKDASFFSHDYEKKSGTWPDKWRKYDATFKVEALRLASENRSTQAAAQQLGISPKLLYRWQQEQLVAEVGSAEVARDPEVR
ncbi:transposase [Hymenobacter sp. GOD-10R]|uniref:transposase n=1 Tax=Hymenobacter sp. GOD-10R TaxID=3093922 RepID=UPI002D773982|nr:transposase [Hymenobacter sp. GOD-10R]WRQ31846.1 transposase [Hymenobacter sp. GOD-10R]